MPTLYDNFSQVRQYIDQGKPDLTSYVTKTELANCSYVTTSELNSYLPLTGGTLSGNLFAGDQEKTTVTFLATRRKCGGESGTSYMASFFTNSDGRSKFAHKSYTGTKADVSSDADDAFMCFNAYGFKIAYSGNQGVAASTEYELLHTGNIGNLSYATTSQLSDYLPLSGGTINGNLTISATYTNAAYITTNNYMKDVNGNGWYFNRNGNDIFKVMAGSGNIGISPTTTNARYLGSSGLQWAYTYTRNLILNGTDIVTTINGIFSYDSSTGTLSITTIS